MANLKGITVEIGGDTTKLTSALQGVNKEIKNTQSQLKDVEKLLKLDPSNTELVAQKQRLLGDAIRKPRKSWRLLKRRRSRLTSSWQKERSPRNSMMPCRGKYRRPNRR